MAFEEPGAASPALLFALSNEWVDRVWCSALTADGPHGSVQASDLASDYKVGVLRFLTFAWTQCIARLPAAGLVLVMWVATASAQETHETTAVETGALKKDAIVAPVRRAFPKTPSDRELNRLSATDADNPKPRKKSKKH